MCEMPDRLTSYLGMQVGEGMTVEALQSQMQLLYNQYTDKVSHDDLLGDMPA